MSRSVYPCKPIGSIPALARALSCSVDELHWITENASQLYHPKRLPKKDGEFREVYKVDEPLYSLQRRIVKRFFNRVRYPPYLGAVRDKVSPRSDIRDASIHAHQILIVKLDIDDFFPSVKDSVVMAVWKRLFRFPAEVASLLTQLTTYSGFLPQGAPTSPGLASLIFWDVEPAVEAHLRELGFRYSRYVDDVTVSSDRYVSMEQLEPVFSEVHGMFASKGLRPKRSKTDIQTSGHALQVHGLNVNGVEPTMPQDTSARIRTAVWQCEQRAVADRSSPDYRYLWHSVQGRVQRMRSLNLRSAERYLARLAAVKPIPE